MGDVADVGRLFDAGEAEVPEVRARGPVDKTFRVYDPDQMFLMPPSIQEWVSEDHLARFVLRLS